MANFFKEAGKMPAWKHNIVRPKIPRYGLDPTKIKGWVEREGLTPFVKLYKIRKVETLELRDLFKDLPKQDAKLFKKGSQTLLKLPNDTKELAKFKEDCEELREELGETAFGKAFMEYFEREMTIDDEERTFLSLGEVQPEFLLPLSLLVREDADTAHHALFKTASAMMVDQVSPYYFLAKHELRVMGNVQAAHDAAYHCLTHTPDNQCLLVELGNVFSVMRDYPQARYWYKRALDIDDNALECLLNLAEATMFDNDWKHASLLYDRVLELGDGDAEVEAMVAMSKAKYYCWRFTRRYKLWRGWKRAVREHGAESQKSAWMKRVFNDEKNSVFVDGVAPNNPLSRRLYLAVAAAAMTTACLHVSGVINFPLPEFMR